jgi:hypothetical protein
MLLTNAARRQVSSAGAYTLATLQQRQQTNSRKMRRLVYCYLLAWQLANRTAFAFKQNTSEAEQRRASQVPLQSQWVNAKSFKLSPDAC